jgi:hypothetical protein
MEMHPYKTYKEQFARPIGGKIVFFKDISKVDGIIPIIFIRINLDSPLLDLNSLFALGFALMPSHPQFQPCSSLNTLTT